MANLPTAEPPRIVFVDHALLQTGVGPGRVRLAGYLHGQQMVLLPHEWDFRKLSDQRALVHELVHHTQNKAGVDVQSHESERQARHVAAQWTEDLSIAMRGMSAENG